VKAAAIAYPTKSPTMRARPAGSAYAQRSGGGALELVCVQFRRTSAASAPRSKAPTRSGVGAFRAVGDMPPLRTRWFCPAAAGVVPPVMVERYFRNAPENKRSLLSGNKRSLSLPSGSGAEPRA